MSAPEPTIVVRRPLLPDDATAMMAIMGDPDVLPGLLQLPYATEAAWKKRIEEMPVGPTTAELFIVAARGGEVLGNAGVHPFRMCGGAMRPACPCASHRC